TYIVTLTVEDDTGMTKEVKHEIEVKKPQKITFKSSPPTKAVVGGPPYVVAAEASPSGLAVSFSSGTPSVCNVSGTTATFVGVGTCVIDASQSGAESEFAEAVPQRQSFSVGKGSQTITFT